MSDSFRLPLVSTLACAATLCILPARLVGQSDAGLKLIAFPSFGFAVTPPAGWKQDPHLVIGTAAYWQLPTQKAADFTAGLVVEIDSDPKEPLQQYTSRLANRFVKPTDGTPTITQTTLGGEPAMLLKVAARRSVGNRSAIVCLHSGQYYLVEALSRPGSSVDTDLETLRSGWRWLPYGDPAADLATETVPALLFGGAVEVRIPAVMRAFPQDQPGDFNLAVFDCRTHYLAFVAELQVLQNPNGATLMEVREALSARVPARLGMPGLLTWHAGVGALPYYISDGQQTRADPDHPTVRSFGRFGVVKLGKDKIGLFTFTVTGQTDADRQAYDDAANRMIKSVLVHPEKWAK